MNPTEVWQMVQFLEGEGQVLFSVPGLFASIVDSLHLTSSGEERLWWFEAMAHGTRKGVFMKKSLPLI